MTARPIANKYCEGKVKSTLKRGLKELEIVKRETYIAFDCKTGVPMWKLWSLIVSSLNRLGGLGSHGGRVVFPCGAYQHQFGVANKACIKVPGAGNWLGTYRL